MTSRDKYCKRLLGERDILEKLIREAIAGGKWSDLVLREKEGVLQGINLAISALP